ncbi:GNAT family N-acetyltransferase [Enterococcus sp.]|uniref:GNAT family N-acetyltransferase n=1 Tax=Enterococcus sp. TaxID=35783 RepID=UPI002906E104|nr:GNAT family N-acetyltransferase [Enterococcus sp.]MDU5335163.1 GNAT family N-acetyltransferase [Enterococcus sp.]
MIQLIETMTDEDLESIAAIWLESNLETHDFIDKNYWLMNYQNVKEMLPTAKIYAYFHNGKIVGFLGLINEYIAGIFVLKNYRSLGIGTQLLDFVKSENFTLTLNVYQKNQRAVQFYLRQGFTILKKENDIETNEIELLMKWIA